MNTPLMPKATAVWLVENTALTFEQIANFCGLHPLEVKGIADGEVATGIVGLDPVVNGQLSRDELERCSADATARLKLIEGPIPVVKAKSKGARYTPVSKRGDRPDAIAWLLKFHPEVTDAQIQKMLGTTKATIDAVRDRSHWNSPNIKPRDPVSLGICTQTELDAMVRKAFDRKVRQDKKAARSARAAGQPIPESATPAPMPQEIYHPQQEEAKAPEHTIESVFGPKSE